MTGSTRTPNPAESLFCDLIDELREHDDRVEEGTIMGGRCARVSGEFLGLVGYKGSGMVVKLPRDRVDEYLSLTFSVGSIIYGGGSWTWSKWGNSGYAVSGKNWVLGGIIGALISGLAVTIANKLFTAAGA